MYRLVRPFPAYWGSRESTSWPRLTILTQAEWVAGWVGVDGEDGTRLLYRIGEADRTKFNRPKSCCVEIRDGQVEVQLLGRAIWPPRSGIRRRTLECQLERRPIGLHLTPFWITDIQLPIQEVRVEGRKSRRFGQSKTIDRTLIDSEAINV